MLKSSNVAPPCSSRLWARGSGLAAILLFVLAAPTEAALTGAEKLALVYDSILSARFDRADAQLKQACPPAPDVPPAVGESRVRSAETWARMP